MELPEFGYIESDINHLTSIPILVIIPLLMVLAVYRWFRKEKKSIKENPQNDEWGMLFSRTVLCFVIIVSGWGMLKYGGMLGSIKHCSSFDPDIVGAGAHHIQSESIFYNFNAYQIDYQEWPFCPEDKEALEARIKRVTKNSAERELYLEEEKTDTQNKNATPSPKTVQDK